MLLSINSERKNGFRLEALTCTPCVTFVLIRKWISLNFKVNKTNSKFTIYKTLYVCTRLTTATNFILRKNNNKNLPEPISSLIFFYFLLKQQLQLSKTNSTAHSQKYWRSNFWHIAILFINLKISQNILFRAISPIYPTYDVYSSNKINSKNQKVMERPIYDISNKGKQKIKEIALKSKNQRRKS